MSRLALKSTSEGSLEVVVRRLQRLSPLSIEARSLLLGLSDWQKHAPGRELVRETEPGPRPAFVRSGWAAKVRSLADGRRQILGFILPGDAVGLHVRAHPSAPVTIMAMTPLATVDAMPVLRAINGKSPPAGLMEALAAAAALDEALLLDQIVRLGRQTAYERLCHLLLELHDRLGDVGAAELGAFAMPLTQEILADAMGLSIVHVNRIVQQLRRERLVDLRNGRAVLLDMEQLRNRAHYRRPDTMRSTLRIESAIDAPS